MTTPDRPRPTSVPGRLRRTTAVPTGVLLALVLALGLTGGATARSMITGAQVKDRSLTGKDVKDGSLRVADLSKPDVKKLKQSAYGAPPSGTTVVGAGELSDTPQGATNLRAYVPLGFKAAKPFVANGDPSTATLGYGSGAAAQDTYELPECTGSADAPTAPRGRLCVYVAQAFNIIDGTADLDPGVQATSGADASGFEVTASSSAGGPTVLRFTWAYTAP